MSHLYRSHQLAMVFLDVEHRNAYSHACEYIQDGGARRVEQDPIYYQVGLRKYGGGAEEEGRTRDIAGNGGANGSQPLPASQGAAVSGAGDLGSKSTQRKFTVIAGAQRLFHLGLSVGQ